MTIDISFIKADGYLIAEASGKWTTHAASVGIAEIAERARSLGYNRILMDLRKLSAPPTDFDRFLAGVAVAEVFPFSCKVAAVRPADLLDRDLPRHVRRPHPAVGRHLHQQFSEQASAAAPRRLAASAARTATADRRRSAPR